MNLERTDAICRRVLPHGDAMNVKTTIMSLLVLKNAATRAVSVCICYASLDAIVCLTTYMSTTWVIYRGETLAVFFVRYDRITHVVHA